MSSAKEKELSALVAILTANGTFNSRSLNVKSSDAPVTSQTNWTKLNAQLIADNTSSNFSKLMSDIIYSATYDSSIAVFKSLVSSLATNTGKTARIVVCLPDGTVYFDSGKTNNTYANASGKSINENHNSRACIINAQLLRNGISFESKYSTTVNNFEDYAAMRVGPHGASLGTVRYSIY
jgi:hypothetical protein